MRSRQKRQTLWRLLHRSPECVLSHRSSTHDGVITQILHTSRLYEDVHAHRHTLDPADDVGSVLTLVLPAPAFQFKEDH